MAETEGDARNLERLGHGAGSFARRLGGFSSFAIGFSVISVLTGVTSAFGDALAAGGPAGLCVGWIVVSCGTLACGAEAMAEPRERLPHVGRAVPTGPRSSAARRGAGAPRCSTSPGRSRSSPRDRPRVCAGAGPHLSSGGSAPGLRAVRRDRRRARGVVDRHLGLASWRGWNDASAYGPRRGRRAARRAALREGACAPRGPPRSLGGEGGHRQSGRTRLLMHSLVLGVWTFTGFDAAAHVSEETHHPERRAPRGIVSAVGVSAVAGFAARGPRPPLSILRRGSRRRRLRPTRWRVDGLQGLLGPTHGRRPWGLVAFARNKVRGLSSVDERLQDAFAFARDRGAPLARSACAGIESGARECSPHATAAARIVPIALGRVVCRHSLTLPSLAGAALATAAPHASHVLPRVALGAARAPGCRMRRAVVVNPRRARASSSRAAGCQRDRWRAFCVQDGWRIGVAHWRSFAALLGRASAADWKPRGQRAACAVPRSTWPHRIGAISARRNGAQRALGAVGAVKSSGRCRVAAAAAGGEGAAAPTGATATVRDFDFDLQPQAQPRPRPLRTPTPTSISIPDVASLPACPPTSFSEDAWRPRPLHCRRSPFPPPESTKCSTRARQPRPRCGSSSRAGSSKRANLVELVLDDRASFIVDDASRKVLLLGTSIRRPPLSTVGQHLLVGFLPGAPAGQWVKLPGRGAVRIEVAAYYVGQAHRGRRAGGEGPAPRPRGTSGWAGAYGWEGLLVDHHLVNAETSDMI